LTAADWSCNVVLSDNLHFGGLDAGELIVEVDSETDIGDAFEMAFLQEADDSSFLFAAGFGGGFSNPAGRGLFVGRIFVFWMVFLKAVGVSVGLGYCVYLHKSPLKKSVIVYLCYRRARLKTLEEVPDAEDVWHGPKKTLVRAVVVWRSGELSEER
jgi:hypothetical protein